MSQSYHGASTEGRAGFDSNAYGSTGDNPIMTAGRVAINGSVDSTLIRTRRHTAGQGASLYGGDTSDESFTIMPHDPVFEQRKAGNLRRNRTVGNDTYAPVLSTFNGAGNKGDSVATFMSNILFRGFAGGDGARGDTTGRNSGDNRDIAIIQAGTLTTRNTGPTRIEAGDTIVWMAPMPGDKRSYDRGIVGSKRIMPYLLPFRVGAQLANSFRISDLLRDPKARDWSNTDAALTVAAVRTRKAIKSSIILAAHVLFMLGFAQPVQGAFSPGAVGVQARQAASAQFRAAHPVGGRTGVDRRALYTALAGALEFPKISKSSGAHFDGEGLTPEASAANYAAAVFASGPLHMLSPASPVTHKAEPGDFGELTRLQRAYIGDVMSAADASNMEARSRIVGVCLAGGMPGETIDLFMKHG